MRKLLLVMILSALVGGCKTQPYSVTDGDTLGLGSRPEDMKGEEFDGDYALDNQVQGDSDNNLKREDEQMTQTDSEEKQSGAMEGSGQELEQLETMVVKTNKGEVEIKLYKEEAKNTILNYLKKAETGHYKNLKFHRVEDWVIQGGDPLGNGTGGGNIKTELSNIPFKKGSAGVARANNIEVSNDSQFFICKTDCSWLSGQYTIFGEVTKGMEVVEQIVIGDNIEEVSFK